MRGISQRRHGLAPSWRTKLNHTEVRFDEPPTSGDPAIPIAVGATVPGVGLLCRPRRITEPHVGGHPVTALPPDRCHSVVNLSGVGPRLSLEGFDECCLGLGEVAVLHEGPTLSQQQASVLPVPLRMGNAVQPKPQHPHHKGREE